MDGSINTFRSGKSRVFIIFIYKELFINNLCTIRVTRIIKYLFSRFVSHQGSEVYTWIWVTSID